MCDTSNRRASCLLREASCRQQDPQLPATKGPGATNNIRLTSRRSSLVIDETVAQPGDSTWQLLTALPVRRPPSALGQLHPHESGQRGPQPGRPLHLHIQTALWAAVRLERFMKLGGYETSSQHQLETQLGLRFEWGGSYSDACATGSLSVPCHRQAPVSSSMLSSVPTMHSSVLSLLPLMTKLTAELHFKRAVELGAPLTLKASSFSSACSLQGSVQLLQCQAQLVLGLLQLSLGSRGWLVGSTHISGCCRAAAHMQGPVCQLGGVVLTPGITCNLGGSRAMQLLCSSST